MWLICYFLKVGDQEAIVVLAELREHKKMKNSDYEKVADAVSICNGQPS